MTGATLRGKALSLYFLQASDWQKPSSLFFSREENTCFLGQAIFAKQKTKMAKKKNDRHVIKTTKETKYATHDSTRGSIGAAPLRADHRRLLMLHWPARLSGVLITPAPF